MNSQRSSDPLPPSGDFGELLKSRVEALRHQEARSQGMVCAECGSPLSETSQFCWMCGAAREPGPSGVPAEVHPPYSIGPQEAPARLQEIAPQEPQSVAADASVDTASGAERADAFEVPPASEPELFSQIYGRDRKRIESEDEQEDQEGRKFDYRLIAVPLLLALIVFLAYQQRTSAKNFFAMMREMVAEQIAQLWPSENEDATPARRAAEPSKPVSARKRVLGRQSQPKAFVLVRSPRPSSIPLRVRVEGQPGPLVPAIARVAQPIPFQRAIAVGITGEAFSMPVPPAPMRVVIAPTESLSLLLRQVPPVYPAAAREAKIEGSVVLKAIIRKDGNVGELSLVSGHPMLVQAAMDAVKQWVYRPYYRNGEPMDVETLVVVEFSLAIERTAVGGGF